MNVLILSAGTRNKIVQYFKKTIGNSFFKGKFGRCEFDKISSYQDKGQVMCYLMKYIEKTR